MNNPYFPHRKIRHAKLLTRAGFTINRKWYRDLDKPQRETNCNKLIYWKRGNIHIIFLDYEQVSIKKLVERIISQAEYNTKNRAQIVFRNET
jgi:hypothetical protein